MSADKKDTLSSVAVRVSLVLFKTAGSTDEALFVWDETQSMAVWRTVRGMLRARESLAVAADRCARADIPGKWLLGEHDLVDAKSLRVLSAGACVPGDDDDDDAKEESATHGRLDLVLVGHLSAAAATALPTVEPQPRPRGAACTWARVRDLHLTRDMGDLHQARTGIERHYFDPSPLGMTDADSLHNVMLAVEDGRSALAK